MDIKVNGYHYPSGLIVSRAPEVILGLGVLSAIAGGVILGGYFFHTPHLQLVSFNMAAAIAATGILSLVISRLAKQRHLIQITTVIAFIVAGLAAASWHFHYALNSNMAFSIMIGAGAFGIMSGIMWNKSHSLSQKEILESMKNSINIESSGNFGQFHQWLHQVKHLEEWSSLINAINGKTMTYNGVQQTMLCDLLLKPQRLEFNVSEKNPNLQELAIAYKETYDVNTEKALDAIDQNENELVLIKMSGTVVGGAFVASDKTIQTPFKRQMFVELDVTKEVEKYQKRKAEQQKQYALYDVLSDHASSFPFSWATFLRKTSV